MSCETWRTHDTCISPALLFFAEIRDYSQSMFLSLQINQSLIPLLPANDVALYFPFGSCKKAIRVA